MARKGYLDLPNYVRLVVDNNTNLTGVPITINGTTYTWGTEFAVGANLGASLDNLVTYVNTAANNVTARCCRHENTGVGTNLGVVFVPSTHGGALTITSTSAKCTFSAVAYFKVGSDPTIVGWYVPLTTKGTRYFIALGGGTGDVAWGGNSIDIRVGTGRNTQEISYSIKNAAALVDDYFYPGDSQDKTATQIGAYASATVPTTPYLRFTPSVAGMIQTVSVSTEYDL